MMSARPDSMESLLLPNQLVQLAAQAVIEGDLPAAREYLAQVISIDPDNQDALLWQSVAAENYATKLRLLQRVLARNPDESRAKVLLTWAEGRQSGQEPLFTNAEIECLTPCPYLGIVDDPAAHFAYPSPGNVCHAEATKRRPPRDVLEDTQKDICLTISHLTCPTFCRVRESKQRRSAADWLGLRDYFDFFGLDEEPFSIVPIPRFYYPVGQHEEVLRACRQVIFHQQGLAVISAPVGLGKTLLLRALFEELFRDPRFCVAFFPHSGFKSEYAMMEAILRAFHVDPRRKRSGHDLEAEFQRFVTAQVIQEGKVVVLLFDEAHQMTPKLLNQVRRILDFHVREQQMVQIVLAGQPSLAAKIARLPALQDRVVVNETLEPLPPSEVRALVTARLHEAGSSNGIFTPAAIRAITDLTGGEPRKINILCMRCLWEAFERGRHTVDHELVRSVAGRGERETTKTIVAEEPVPARNLPSLFRFLRHRESNA